MINFDELTRDDLIDIRLKCDESLLYFTRFWFRVLRGTKFIVNNHHEVICNSLEKLENYELDLLNINIPPRFSKTEIAAVNFIARGIGMNPTSNWLYITASDELRAQTSVSIRDIVQHPYFYIMYGVELKSDQNGKNLWRTTQGGGLKTATIFGQVTGFGAGQMVDHSQELEDFIRTFEGCIVLDDINKIDDAGQENALSEKVTRVLFNTIFSRKNSKDTPIVNIQQRAGISDATAQLMEYYEGNPRAEFLVMPVVKDGVPLWEWKHDLEDIERLRTSPKTVDVFGTQYMQEPFDFKNKLFENIQYFSDKEAILKVSEGSLAYIDVADEGGDYLCLIVGHVVLGLIYITDVVFTKANTDVTVPLCSELLNRYKVPYCRVETNGMGAVFLKWMRQYVNSTQLIGLTNKTNKNTRIIMNSSYVIRNFRFLENQTGEYNQYLNSLKSFLKEGNNKNDDAPDATTGLAQMFGTFMPHLDT